jgi:hypothetical protein
MLDGWLDSTERQQIDGPSSVDAATNALWL